jgi:hypothetical protein
MDANESFDIQGLKKHYGKRAICTRRPVNPLDTVAAFNLVFKYGP